jgi:hypothetical protein
VCPEHLSGQELFLLYIFTQEVITALCTDTFMSVPFILVQVEYLYSVLHTWDQTKERKTIYNK